MSKVIVVDEDGSVRNLLLELLTREGHEVLVSASGSEALELMGVQSPDLVLLSTSLSGLDGFEVLRRIRANPATQDSQVVMLTWGEVARYEQAALELGAEHLISKPLDLVSAKLTIRVALRDGEFVTSPLRIGESQLDERLGGGIPLSSLALIEGTSSAGKSVICQHFMFSALRDGHKVTCFSSENNAKGLISQMASLGFDVSDDVRKGRFRIVQLEEPSPGEDRGRLLNGLMQGIERVPRDHRVICIDSITNLASASVDHAVVGFFTFCKRVCQTGRVVILVAHTAAFEEKMLVRLRSLCGAHLSLRVENVGGKQARLLEVCKIQNSEGMTGNSAYFTVEHKLGMRSMPFSRARA